MEELNNNLKEKRINWPIIIFLIVIIVVVGIFLYVDYQKTKNNSQNPPISEEEYMPEPISKDDNPRREETIKDNSKYGCASPETIKPTTTQNADIKWEIPKDGATKTISLGKHKIKNLIYTKLDIPKFWLYFMSEKLSDREDKFYSLEKSYVSKMTLVVNGYEKEIKLGGTEHMLIELDNYPLGDIYPYDKETYLEFEILIELKCNNIKNGTCLDNSGESLEYLNGADITSMFKIFAIGCQGFEYDMSVDAEFEY